MAGLDGVVLGQVREHGGGDDIGDGDGHGDAEADDQGEALAADEADDRLVIVDTEVQQHIGDAGTQQQGLFAKLPGQDVYQRIGTYTHADGDDGDDGDPDIRQCQKIRDVVDLGGVEEGEGHPHDQVTDGDDGEILIGEDGLQGLTQRLGVGFGHDVVLLPDHKGGNQRGNGAAHTADDEGNPQGPDFRDAGAHEHPLEQ